MAFKEEENMFVAFQVIMTIVKINCVGIKASAKFLMEKERGHIRFSATMLHFSVIYGVTLINKNQFDYLNKTRGAKCFQS